MTEYERKKYFVIITGTIMFMFIVALWWPFAPREERATTKKSLFRELLNASGNFERAFSTIGEQSKRILESEEFLQLRRTMNSTPVQAPTPAGTFMFATATPD